MDYPVIDCHTHIYPKKIAAKAVKTVADFYGVTADRDATAEALLRMMDGAGVSRSLALAVAVDAEHVKPVNDYLISAVRAHPDRLWGFATLHPGMENPAGEVERVLKAGMKGVKLHPDMQAFSLSDPAAEKIYAACEGVCPIMIHTGDRRYHNSNPSLIPAILRRHPRLQLICAHLGGYSEWDDAIRCLRDLPVYVDTSSSSFVLSPERVRELIDIYGEDRVLFGTDFPMWDARPEIDFLLSLGLSDTAYRKIFSENILKLLGEI